MADPERDREDGVMALLLPRQGPQKPGDRALWVLCSSWHWQTEEGWCGCVMCSWGGVGGWRGGMGGT